MIGGFALVVAQFVAAYFGLEYHFGALVGVLGSAALLALLVSFRWAWPLGIAAFFGAKDVWDWPFIGAFFFAAPSVLLTITPIMAALLAVMFHRNDKPR